MLNKNDDQTTILEPPKALVKALRKLLRPLVKLLLSFQITFPFLAELLKSIYVEVADNDFQIEGKKQTDTRISLLTGVHRKDTKRLRQAEVEHDITPSSVSVGAQIIGCWMSDAAYLDEDGEARPLPLKSGSSPSFELLVQSVCKQDIRARVVLDEWLRLGVAEVNEQGLIKLNSGAFIPQNGLDEKAFYLGMNLSDHISAVSHNLLNCQPPLMERCVYYGGLTEASIQELERLSKEKGMEALQALNARALELRSDDNNREDTKHRMNFGVYYYHEPTLDTPAEDK